MTRPTPETLAHRAHPVAAAAPTPATLANAVTPPPAPPVQVSGAGCLVRSLEALGVDVVFGIPGGAILPAYDPLFDSTVRHIVKRAGKVARLPFPAHPHMLRHACGFYLANQGADTRAIQAYLGHRNISNTVIYTSLSPARFNNFWKD